MEDHDYDSIDRMYVLYAIYSIGIPVIAGMSSLPFGFAVLISQAWVGIIHMTLHCEVEEFYDRHFPKDRSADVQKHMFITKIYTVFCSLFSVYVMSVYVDIPHTMPTFIVGLIVYMCTMSLSFVYHHAQVSPYMATE